jgi:hypothetical protein
MCRDLAIVWIVAISCACPAAEWELHEVVTLHDDKLELSESQQMTLTTIGDPYFYARNALVESRDALDKSIAELKASHAQAVRDALTQPQQAILAQLFREWKETESEGQLDRDVDHLTSLLPILKKLRAIKSVAVLEGLERKAMELPKPAPNGPAMIQVDKHFFFEQPIELDKDDELSIMQTVTDYRSFDTYAGGKFCGGFHPDVNIRLVTDHGIVQMLVCFGCAEIRIIDGGTELMVEIEKQAYSALEMICRRTFRHRKGRVRPVVFPETRKAEPSKDLSSRSRTSNPLFKKPGDPASEPHR